MKSKTYLFPYQTCDSLPVTFYPKGVAVLVAVLLFLFHGATLSAQSFPTATPPVRNEIDTTLDAAPSLLVDKPSALRTAASRRPLYSASEEESLDEEAPVEELPDEAMTLSPDEFDESPSFDGDCDLCGGQGCRNCDHCGPVFRRSCRLATAPEIFGGSFPIGLQVFGTIVDGNGTNQFSGNLPLAAHSRRANVADNNRAIPNDRAYFLYQHFNNAQNAFLNPALTGPVEMDASINRYTFGIEKAFFEQRMSVELRMPIAGSTNFVGPAFGVFGGEIGNLAVITKFSLAEGDWYSIVGGVGVDAPTGSDVVGRVGDFWYTVRNESVHILPYLGMLLAPSARCFHQLFVQADVPTNGNEVAYGELHSSTYTYNTYEYSFDDQPLLHVDWQSGYWLYQNPRRPYQCGLAAMFALHYTSTLADSDRIVGVAPPPPMPPPMIPQPTELQFSVPGNQLDVLNLSVGLHALAGAFGFRVAGILPLTDDFERLYDAQLQGSLNVYF